MPNSTLDERLHRYFDDLPTPVPGSPQAAMSRGRSRRRHQIVGALSGIIVFIAALGIAGATLLDNDDTESSGPVAIDSDQSTGAGSQRWYVTDDPYDDVMSTWSFVHLIDDDTLIGTVNNLAMGGNVPDDLTGAVEVWRVEDGQRTVVDTGLETVADMAMVDNELWVLGSLDSEFTFAISADDGASWSLRPTGEPAPERLTEINVEAGDGFVVVMIGGRTSDSGDISSRLLTFVPGADPAPVAEIDGGVAGVWMRSDGDGVVIPGMQDTETLRTTDGREWVEVFAPEEPGHFLGMLDGEEVWITEGVVRIGDETTTALDEIVGRDVVLGEYASNGDEIVLLAVADEEPGDPVLVSTSDGTSWDVLPVAAAPEPFTDDHPQFGRTAMRIDSEGLFLVPANLSRDRGRVITAAVLVAGVEVDGETATTTPATPSTPGLGNVWWIQAPGQAPDATFVDAVSGDAGVIALTSGGTGDDQAWVWDDGHTWGQSPVPIDDVRDLSRTGDAIGILAGAVDGSPDVSMVHRSTDGGRTWSEIELPHDAYSLVLADTYGDDWIVTGSENGRVVRPYTLGPDLTEQEPLTMVEEEGAFELDEIDGDFWLWDYESPIEQGPSAPRRILFGYGFNEVVDIELDELLVRRGATWFGDLTVWLEGTNAGTRIRTSEGIDLEVDSVVDTEGMNEMYVNGLRAWADGLVLLGSMADTDGNTVLFLLTSEDGETWTAVELDVPDELDFEPTEVRLLDVDDTGRMIIDPGADGMLLVVEPARSSPETPIDPNRVAADAFLDAWQREDRETMLELVSDPGVVDNAFAIAGPVGGYTRCSAQSGQFECFVDTAATYQAYVQVGEPGADTGRVSWVGPVAQ